MEFDIISYLLGQASGTPDPKHWAPKAEQTAVFKLYELDMTWPCEAEEYTEG